MLKDDGLLLNHLAISVRHLDLAIDWLTSFGFEVRHRRREGGVLSAWLASEACHLILMQGASRWSEVSSLAKAGAGVHHIAFEVADLEAAVVELKAGGVRFSSEILILKGSRKIFTVRDPWSGVMVELMERT